ncbi:MAG: hypothetical protein O3A85_03480 [Proteobacteria bacterium]|nr:hypothetical protein [Pseudomonadota bacterium]
MTAALDFVCRYRLWLLGVLAVVAAADVVWVAATYLVYPGYLDHGEPVVAMTSWRILDGFPAYPAFESPDLTSNIYGPVTYLTHAIGFLVAGPGVVGSKIAGIVAVTFIPVIIFFSHRRHGLGWASTAVVLAAGFILIGLPTSVWNRPDPFLAFLVTVAVWAMNASEDEQPEWGKSVLIGLCGGLAAGFKLHAGVYFLPVVLFHCWARGFRTLMLISVVGAVVIAAPFAFDLFSLAGFTAWLPLVAAKNTEILLATKVFRYLLFYLSPVVFFIAAIRWSGQPLKKAEAVYFGAFILSVFIVLIPAMKPGAGWYYYFPFLAIVIDMIVRHSASIIRKKSVVLGVVGILATALLLVSVPIQKRFYRALHWGEARKITQEIKKIMAAYPGTTIQMGAGATLVGYNKTLYKPLLAFAGHPYTLDVGIAIETSASGFALSKGVRTRIEECHTQIWLVPTGEAPFAMTGYYGNPVFDDSFKATFHRRYEKRKSFTYFDAWACRR